MSTTLASEASRSCSKRRQRFSKIEEKIMYTMISLIPIRQLVFEQLPVLTTSLLIAELFYKFHSFTLECAAFLTTWYALDGAIKLVRGVKDRQR